MLEIGALAFVVLVIFGVEAKNTDMLADTSLALVPPNGEREERGVDGVRVL